MQKQKPQPEPGERPYQAEGVRVLNPRCRVPLSLIIDDSTCLVNLAHFCIPQFAEVFPDQYRQDWSRLPREIPDSFVREFGEWCRAHGVKGKYSIVPNPACVGWVDRDLPGWTKKALDSSLTLVRDFLTPDWDIHPEMLTHTWVIDTRTGRPYEERSARFMENWEWTTGRSTDEIANYLSYSLRILRNVGFSCEGITTPGGFGSSALPELAQATLASCRDVFRAEIPHYFRHVFTDGDTSVAPRVEYASGLEGTDPRCVVSLIGCTDDWFGGWDGLSSGSCDLFITADGRGGRLPEVIARDEPALLVCHWPGIYYNGEKVGFRIFQEVVRRLHAHYGDGLVWMKLSQIARYWAARTLTKMERQPGGIALYAPFAAPDFTVDVETVSLPEEARSVSLQDGDVNDRKPLQQVETTRQLTAGTWCRSGTRRIAACFDLPRGRSRLEIH
ncbi:MAG: hypothetical protein V4671_32510 [Armatimonadota bacterium]